MKKVIEKKKATPVWGNCFDGVVAISANCLNETALCSHSLGTLHKKYKYETRNRI